MSWKDVLQRHAHCGAPLTTDMLAAGETSEDVIQAYPKLTKDAIGAALLFAAKTAA
ncbi:MAG: DUF433 domain-containing protein [Patescibacteria group bacterium]